MSICKKMRTKFLGWQNPFVQLQTPLPSGAVDFLNSFSWKVEATSHTRSKGSQRYYHGNQTYKFPDGKKLTVHIFFREDGYTSLNVRSKDYKFEGIYRKVVKKSLASINPDITVYDHNLFQIHSSKNFSHTNSIIEIGTALKKRLIADGARSTLAINDVPPIYPKKADFGEGSRIDYDGDPGNPYRPPSNR